MIKREQYDKINTGSGTGDASASNQITQINEAQTGNNYLNLIDAQTADIASHTQTTNTYLSAIRTPKILSTTSSGTLATQIHNISIANIGNATGTITVDGITINLPSGLTLSYNAGGLNNRFPANVFSYNATGTTFIITYVI